MQRVRHMYRDIYIDISTHSFITACITGSPDLHLQTILALMTQLSTAVTKGVTRIR